MLNFDDLIEKDGLYYEINSDVLFTGEVTGSVVGNFKNGKPEGEWLEHYENGELLSKGNYKNGELDGEFLYYYENGQLKEKVIYNRNFTKIYAGDFTYVEDIGQGILKIFLKDRLDIIHKSGRIILSGNYDDAHIVDNSFILIESEDRFSLYTMMGEMIYDFIFSEVFQEGSFILFVSEKDDRINVLNKEEITRKIIDLKLSMNFLYDDYEYYDGDYMVLFNGDDEVLIDSNLDELTNSDARNIERLDFGWSYKSDYGIKLLSDQIVFDFSVFFDNISSSSIHFMGKNNNQWDVYLLDGGTVILDDVDSVYKLSLIHI